MKRWLSFWLCLALALLAALPGCGGDDDTIRIAVAGPMTGRSAHFGDMIKRAAKLKEKEINDAGGLEVNGKKYRVEFVEKDDAAAPEQATSIAREISGNSDFLLVIGHFNSSCSNAAKSEYNNAGIVQFSPGSTNVDVCRGSPYTFRNLYRDDYQGEQIALYMKNVLGLSSAIVMFENDDYGKGLMSSFKARADAIGLEVKGTVSYLGDRTQDYKPLAQQAKASGADSIFIAGLYDAAALITKAVRQDMGMDIPIFGGDGVMSPGFIEIAGDSADGVYIATPFLFNTGNDTEAAKAFFAAFRKAHGKDPDTWAALTYDAAGMALDAIQKAGLDRKAIRDQLASARDIASGYDGVTGVTYFDEEGDCYSKSVYMATVKDGTFVPAPKQMPK